jgi:hypothetical protein
MELVCYALIWLSYTLLMVQHLAHALPGAHGPPPPPPPPVVGAPPVSAAAVAGAP